MFAGTFSSSSGRIDTLAEVTPHRDSLIKSLHQFSQADAMSHWEGRSAVLVAAGIQTTPHGSDATVLECPSSGRIVAAWTRLDNRPDLLAGTQSRPADSDPALIMNAFNRWGARCVEHLLGAFSFMVYDPQRQTLFLARDQMGFRPLYLHRSTTTVAVATSASVFHEIPGLPLTPSQAWMAKYLLRISMSHTETAWPQVQKLPPAHTLTIDLAQPLAAEPRPYFTFRDDAPKQGRRSSDWVDAYRAVLDEAVRCRLETNGPIGCETSGGIDSSTCLALAASLWPGSLNQIHAFGFATAADEPDYILETGRAHGVDNQHIYTAVGGGRSLIDRTIEVLGYPQEVGNGSSYQPFYDACRARGIGPLLSGFGGDECVTNQAPQAQGELIAMRVYKSLWRDMHGSRFLKPPRIAKAFYRNRRPASQDALRAVARIRWPHFALRHELTQRFGLEQAYEQSHRYMQGYTTVNGWILGERLSNPLVPTRLENCALMARSHHVEYRWPLLDTRLIQQYLSTPTIEKRGDGYGRFLHRRAIADVVPAKITWKPSKDMGGSITEAPGPSVRDVRALADNLHPAVAHLIDRDRLLSLATSVANNTTSRPDARYVLRRQRAGLVSLDRFMKRHHP